MLKIGSKVYINTSFVEVFECHGTGVVQETATCDIDGGKLYLVQWERKVVGEWLPETRLIPVSASTPSFGKLSAPKIDEQFSKEFWQNIKEPNRAEKRYGRYPWGSGDEPVRKHKVAAIECGINRETFSFEMYCSPDIAKEAERFGYVLQLTEKDHYHITVDWRFDFEEVLDWFLKS